MVNNNNNNGNTNLLQETIEVLAENGLKPKDVLWVGNLDNYTAWKSFSKVADTYYDSGYGSQEVAADLLVVGLDWWLERHEYDGSEWWEFKRIPKKPNAKINLKALTIDQANAINKKSMVGWQDLDTINNEDA